MQYIHIRTPEGLCACRQTQRGPQDTPTERHHHSETQPQAGAGEGAAGSEGGEEGGRGGGAETHLSERECLLSREYWRLVGRLEPEAESRSLRPLVAESKLS